MNYFAHAVRFVDRPWFAVGTCVPDWLSVVDRQVRMRPRSVEPFATGDGSTTAEVAAGILQHLHDDQWFHGTRGFAEVTGELTRLFRQTLGPEDGFRPGFLGHIVTELLLDDVLIERHPERLERFYDLFQQIRPDVVQDAVNRMARQPTGHLAPFISLFAHERILRDYAEPPRMLFRLNQVLRRIKLNPLPESVCAVFAAGREIVRARVDDLLPAEQFPW